MWTFQRNVSMRCKFYALNVSNVTLLCAVRFSLCYVTFLTLEEEEPPLSVQHEIHFKFYKNVSMN